MNNESGSGSDNNGSYSNSKKDSFNSSSQLSLDDITFSQAPSDFCMGKISL